MDVSWQSFLYNYQLYALNYRIMMQIYINHKNNNFRVPAHKPYANYVYIFYIFATAQKILAQYNVRSA